MLNENTVDKTKESTEKTVQKITENCIENKKTVQKTALKNNENYTENEKTTQKIILLMSENPSITKTQLSENIGISVSAINLSSG